MIQDYRCLCCGEVKQAEEICSCPICGYKMFEMPYDRKEVLCSEIKDFLLKHRLQAITEDLLGIFRTDPQDEYGQIQKSKDEKRFPNFEKIQDYCCNVETTEVFIERIKKSINKIHSYIKTPFEMDYHVGLGNVEKDVSKYDTVLENALVILDLNVSIENITLPKITLHYSESPDQSLIQNVEELLEKCLKLTEKIEKFIRFNNLYGLSFTKKKSNKKNESECEDPLMLLVSAEKEIDKVLNTVYSVDIFSDGTEELTAMTKPLWKAVELVMTLPVLKKKYEYQLNDGTYDEVSFYQRLIEILNTRYTEIDAIILRNDFLSELSENELFDHYNKLIKIDSLGLMGLNRMELSIPGENEKKLNELIGLQTVKDSIQKIKAYVNLNKDSQDLNLHMCFYGNPGTGKTEVARIIAGILFENGILPTNNVVEVDRGGLVGEYLGETPQKTGAVIEQAMGGVLFIDEAYSLISGTGRWDYGHEAVATLIKAMEDHRGEFCVILAGYKNQMLDMMATNPGFRSRIQFELDFPNYSRAELKSITQLMAKKRQYAINESALEKILDVTDVKRKDPNFANAREIRNILDQVIMCHNMRTGGQEGKELAIVDVNRFIEDSNILLPIRSEMNEKKILTGEEELDSLIGLSTVKRMVKKIVNNDYSEHTARRF